MGELLAEQVTPYGGVWIEIFSERSLFVSERVTPYGGVWIEMHYPVVTQHTVSGHALWGRVD